MVRTEKLNVLIIEYSIKDQMIGKYYHVGVELFFSPSLGGDEKESVGNVLYAG